MKTQIEFTSEYFPSYGDESEGVNWDTGLYGKRLAVFLVEKLTAKGVTVSDHFAEDWGWCLEIQHMGNFRMFIGCGALTGGNNEFLCFVEPRKPTIRKWFKTIDVREEVENAVNALYSVLFESSEVQNLRWSD
jgi:hypothetical protein